MCSVSKSRNLLMRRMLRRCKFTDDIRLLKLLMWDVMDMCIKHGAKISNSSTGFDFRLTEFENDKRWYSGLDTFLLWYSRFLLDFDLAYWLTPSCLDLLCNVPVLRVQLDRLQGILDWKRGEVYKMNHSGPKNEPCGTPDIDDNFQEIYVRLTYFIFRLSTMSSWDFI